MSPGREVGSRIGADTGTLSTTAPDEPGRQTGRFDMTEVLVATRRRNRRLDQRGAATAEYAVATVAACGFGGILIALLKSEAVQNLLKAIINFALRAAGLDGVQI